MKKAEHVSEHATPPLGPQPAQEDLEYQNAILQGVSRTFALTIPQLPMDLRIAVGNAYLLCRITDTIEDSDTLTVEQKKWFSRMFVRVVTGETSPESFATELTPLLGGKTLDAERDLVKNTPRVIRVTRSLNPADQAALARCVRVMAAGMEEFQEGRFAHGLRDLEHLTAYCYHVAGVVGEMLTELFCIHSPRMARVRQKLSKLAVSFGQGLQMTNILKDIWEDKSRNVCWLPQAVFSQEGYDLKTLSESGNGNAGFEAGLERLIGITRRHLKNALAYALLIPKSERGVRMFCLWAIGMAMLTLRKINRHRDFRSGAQVKIARSSVRATVLATRLLGWSNTLMRMLFGLTSIGLPRARVQSKRSWA